MLDFPASPVNGQTFTGSNGVSYQYIDPPGIWQVTSLLNNATGTGKYVLQDSPELLGDPTAPTPPVGDNDESLATTEFVQSLTYGVQIERYGGAGDWNGTTGLDNADALVAALAAGRPVVFKAGGNYAFGRQIILPNNAVLIAEGGQATLTMLTGTGKFDAATYAPTWSLAGFYGLNKTGITMKDLKIVMQPNAAIRTCFPIALRGGGGHKLFGLEITGFKEMWRGSICLDSIDGCVIDKPFIHDCTADSITLSPLQITGIVIDSDRVAGNSIHIQINEPRIERLTLGAAAIAHYGPQTDGINIGSQINGGPSGGTITSPYIWDVGEPIDIFADYWTVSNINFGNCSATGVKLFHGASHCTVTGGSIYKTSQAGVAIGAVTSDLQHAHNNLVQDLFIFGVGDMPEVGPVGYGQSGILLVGADQTFKANDNIFRNITIYNNGAMERVITNDGGTGNVIDGLICHPIATPYQIEFIDNRALAGAVNIMESLNVQAITVAAASSINIGSPLSNFIEVLCAGSLTISSLGIARNKLRFVRITGTGSATFVHNATSLILPGGVDLVLAIGDMMILSSDTSGNWICRQVMRTLDRYKLVTDRIYYVRSDATGLGHSGLLNTPSDAFLTVQEALDVIQNRLDLGGKGVIVQVADGTYTGLWVLSGPFVGAGTVTVQGNTTTPANVLISTSAAAVVLTNRARLRVLGVKVTTSAGTAFSAQSGSILDWGSVNFGAAGGRHVEAISAGSIATALQNYEVSGGGLSHLYVVGGEINTRGRTATFTGTPAFTASVVRADRLGLVRADSMVFVGGATGKRYQGESNAVIDTNGGGATYFPGDVAGTVASGSQYI